MRLTILPERLLIVGAVAILSYLAIVISIYLSQEKMLYFTHKRTRAAEASQAKRLGLFLWPANSADYHGFVSMDFSSQSKGVVLLFHGNAGSAIDRFYYIPEIQRLGYRVVLFEYPGYGARPGPLRESAFVEAALRAARAAVEEFGGPLYVWGESLGCGIASALAGGGEVAVKGTVMVTPWDTLPNLAQSLYWYLPSKWLVKDKYDNIKNLRNFKGPVAVAMADKDEIIPNKLTKRLFKSLPGNKRLWTLQNVGHNDWLTVVDRTWWKEIMDFVNSDTRNR